MRITKISNLVDGRKYWYIGVRYQCHWEIYHTCDTYRNGNDWSKMIVFDNEKEAIEKKTTTRSHLSIYYRITISSF